MNVCAPLFFLYSSMLVNLYIFTCIKSQGEGPAGGSAQEDVAPEGDFESSLAAELIAQGIFLPSSSIETVEPVHGVTHRMRPAATASKEPSPTPLALRSKAVVPNRAVPPTPPGQRVMDGILNDLHLSFAAGSQAQQPEPDKESAEVSKDVVGANEMPSVALSQAGEDTQTEAGKDKVNQSEEVAAARPSVQVGNTTYRPLSNFMKKKASPEGGAARPGTGEDNTSAPLEGGAATAEGGAAPLAEGGDKTSAPLEGGAATLAATQVATAPPQWTCWKCEWADVDPEKDACPRSFRRNENQL